MSKTPLLPSTLPLIPLPPPQVLYPHLQVTVSLPPTQLALVLTSIAENARHQKIDDEFRMLAVVPVVEIERRVGRWACAARIRRIEKSKDDSGNFLLVLEGLARIRLPRSLPPVLSILPPIPLTNSTFSLPLPVAEPSPTTDLIPLATKLLPPQLHSRLNMLQPSLLADLLVSVLGIDWDIRVELLGIPDLEERNTKVHGILLGLLTSRGIPPPTSDGSSKPTSSSLIRRPAIRPPVPPASQSSQIPEDLVPLTNLLAARNPELTDSAKHTIRRELSRLFKIHSSSSEYSVSRTYIEWLLSLPWKRVSETGEEIDLEEARRRLDSEHEGLESVKRRVVEYLAVYRLKKQLFLEDQKRKQQLLEKSTPTSEVTGKIETATANDLLELIPQEERKEVEKPLPLHVPGVTSIDDAPPSDVFRDKGPILLLVGPPGVGKTSIARSLAAAVGRKFHRISLGGVRDEAEIRGHRRTYVGALPGTLVQGLRKVGVSNPLILLDEIDKLGTSSYNGDPGAALLETLDPAQNWTFHDHYIGDVPVDLSQVLFIATANTLDTISPPLLDRCEVIECSGYVTDEKVRIAKRFLLPKQIEENGLAGLDGQSNVGGEEDKQGGVEMGDEVLMKVITDYTREAGVRSLERELGKLCRTKAVEFSSSRDPKSSDTATQYSPVIGLSDLERILGMPKFDQELKEDVHRPGVVTGMSYQGSGQGGILLIESILIPGGKGRLVLTGSLGDVIKESAELGLTWVKSHAFELGITAKIGDDPMDGVDIHLHLPSGAVKKDGPSAGVGMVLAFVSLLTGKSIPSNVAVTGEMTLRGAVTAVGGIKEKVLGAHRAGITKVILPSRNQKDVQADLPESLKESIKFVFVSKIDEVIEEIWGKEIWEHGDLGRGIVRARRGRGEARL